MVTVPSVDFKRRENESKAPTYGFLFSFDKQPWMMWFYLYGLFALPINIHGWFDFVLDLGVCHGWFDFCKVEFNKPFCWFYSVPNLLVFQHLVTLYLGGFVVRVVSEIECWLLKSVQENRDSRLDLAGDSRLQAARCSTRAKHARSWTVMLAGALQDKIGQLTIRLSRDWISRLDLATQSSHEVKPRASPVLKNLT